LLTAMWDGLVIRQAYTQDQPQALLALFDSMLKNWLARDTQPKQPAKPKLPPKIKPIVAKPAIEKEAKKAEADLRQSNLFKPEKKKKPAKTSKPAASKPIEVEP